VTNVVPVDAHTPPWDLRSRPVVVRDQLEDPGVVGSELFKSRLAHGLGCLFLLVVVTLVRKVRESNSAHEIRPCWDLPEHHSHIFFERPKSHQIVVLKVSVIVGRAKIGSREIRSARRPRTKPLQVVCSIKRSVEICHRNVLLIHAFILLYTKNSTPTPRAAASHLNEVAFSCCCISLRRIKISESLSDVFGGTCACRSFCEQFESTSHLRTFRL